MIQESKPIRILLVEDNIADAVLLRDTLDGASEFDFHVCHADSLAAGRELVGKQPFDLVLLDLSLPDSYGMATFERINDVAAHLPVILLTGGGDQEIGIEAVRRGAQDYLVKGQAGAEMLVRSIRYAIERKQTQRDLKKAHDGLEQKVHERTSELQRLNELFQMLIACNESLVRTTDEESLLREICHAVIDVGQYRMAWVGFAQDDQGKSVLPAGAVGFEEGYLAQARITWADTERGRGPTGSAIRTGQVCIGEDFLTDPTLSPWRQQAMKRGFQSSIALPLFAAGKAFGALTIYASQPAAFDAKSVDVLKQLADDLAFGITALRTESALRRIEREVLDATEREQQRIGRDLHDGIQCSLAGASMMLGALKQGLSKGLADQTQLIDSVDSLTSVIKDTLNQTRGLARGLCPLELKSDGLMRALHRLAVTTSELSRVDCRFQCDDPVFIEDENVATQLYRICQEAMNNALKHSKAKSITISMDRRPGVLTLEVRDDGIGLPDNAGNGNGLGLQTMNYRARMIGADVTVGLGDHRGTVVRCTLDEMKV